jgi:acyl-coenzyme A thioesterase PaaI-like protein
VVAENFATSPTYAGDVPFQFDDATSVTSLGDGRYSARVVAGWDIGGNANGGYLMALCARAMRDLTGDPCILTMTGNFLAPINDADVTIDVELVKRGRTVSTTHASMRADGREVLRVVAVTGELPRETPPVHSAPMPEMPAPDVCFRDDRGDRWTKPALVDKITLRLHPDDAAFMEKRVTGVARMRGWLSFVDDRPLDDLALLLAVDALPPAVFNLGSAVRWVPTIQLTTYVRNLPAPGPVLVVAHCDHVQGNLLDENVTVWDSRGTLVAQARQLAMHRG